MWESTFVLLWNWNSQRHHSRAYYGRILTIAAIWRSYVKLDQWTIRSINNTKCYDSHGSICRWFYHSNYIIITGTVTPFSRAMLLGIHSIFLPPSITKHQGHDPVSEAKLDKGEGSWNTNKEILGWDFDGDKYTITLPSKKCDTIISLSWILLKKKTSLPQQVSKQCR